VDEEQTTVTQLKYFRSSIAMLAVTLQFDDSKRPRAV
jgi:hypothetical protein